MLKNIFKSLAIILLMNTSISEIVDRINVLGNERIPTGQFKCFHLFQFTMILN